MSDEDDFKPRLGKMRSRGGGKRARRYVGMVVAAAARSGEKGAVRNRRFDGSRIGRGASMGRLLGSRDRLAAYRTRRAIVKTRLVRLGGKGLAAARAHLKYIQRDGVTREGAPGELYSAERDQADGKAFLERCDGDRHQFRFIVSAEDGSEYSDLKPFIRRLMSQMEQDLETRLDWVAVDHFNTAHPHTHIMLRGMDDRGQNLVIAREYISHGIRERAAELATLDLGPCTNQEIEARLRRDIGEERMTTIDRQLLGSMDADLVVSAADRDSFRQSLRAGRLRKLAGMGLAEDLGAGRWRLAEDLEGTLRTIGERGDIVRKMQRELTARRLDRADIDQVIAENPREPIIGRLIHRGFSEELDDRHFVMIDGVDGRVHYVEIGRGDATPSLPEGATVRIEPRTVAVTEADRTIDVISRANGGRYSVDLHLRHDPNASEAFATTHVRRLEAMRRAGAAIERHRDGSWMIGENYLAGAEAFAQRELRNRPVTLTVLSRASITELATADAPTWLDRELAAGGPTAIRDTGFGREVRSALASRRQWLIEQQLGIAENAGIRLRGDALARLGQRELQRAGEELGGELGKAYRTAQIGERIEGVISRRVDLEGGSYALVERSRDFALVPWRDVLERNLGKFATGIMRMDGINWQFGRGRVGPEIG